MENSSTALVRLIIYISESEDESDNYKSHEELLDEDDEDEDDELL